MSDDQKGKAKPLEVRQWWHTSLIPGFGRQRQIDLCEFKVNLGYPRSVQKQIQVLVAHILIAVLGSHTPFNSSTRGNIKWEERKALTV